MWVWVRASAPLGEGLSEVVDGLVMLKLFLIVPLLALALSLHVCCGLLGVLGRADEVFFVELLEAIEALRLRREHVCGVYCCSVLREVR